tara:strand:+ start:332 stop:505 length:174 start_codon:yes stop_codon:yes gene_type:complete
MIYKDMESAIEDALKIASNKNIDRVVIRKAEGGFSILTIYVGETLPLMDHNTRLIIS